MAITRRQFLQQAGLLSLLIPLSSPKAALILQTGETPAALHEFNDWIWICPDNRVVIGVSQCEVGQGIYTGLAEVVAAEMDADWQNVSVQFVTGRDAYRHTGGGETELSQYVAASLSMTHFYQRMREAGAQARAFFLAAGAQAFHCSANECESRDSYIINKTTGEKRAYADLIAYADQLDSRSLPLKLKNAAQENATLIGKEIKRVDTPLKVTGQAVFGIDIKLPNMLVAVPWMVPTLNGKIISIKNKAEIMAIPGVVDIVTSRHWSTFNMFKLDENLSANTVLVIAESYWQAKKAVERLDVDVQDSEKDNFSSQTIARDNAQRLADGPFVTASQKGSPEKIFASPPTATTLHQATYTAPYVAHATMEPCNATCYVEKAKVTAWGPFQGQDLVRQTLAKMAGLSPAQVEVNTTFIGGSFGRKFNPDAIMHAFIASKAVNRPVKVIYPREIDLQHSYYRPGNHAHYRAVIDENGYPLALRAQYASDGLFWQVHRQDRVNKVGGWDETIVENVYNTPYQIPHLQVDCAIVPQNISLTFLRGVGSIASLFFLESFISELSHKANLDEVDYRQHLLSRSPEMLRVITATRAAMNWSSPLAKHRYRGCATNFWVARDDAFLTYVVLMVEVVVENNRWRVIKAVCGVDCGKVINPNLVRAAIEGGIGFGLSCALRSELHFEQGAVQESNFDSYGVILLQDMPEIEVVILDSTRPPQGTGEVSTAVVAPAIASALHQATGHYYRTLPLPETLS